MTEIPTMKMSEKSRLGWKMSIMKRGSERGLGGSTRGEQASLGSVEPSSLLETGGEKTGR
jgi:hypothetical protein